MLNPPLVSVLMTVYNRQEYVAEAIESVLESTFRDFELIIVDDGSTDRSLEIAHRYASADRRVRLYENEANLGDYPNRKRAASYARGKYLKYLDSDDKIYDFGLEYCVEQMEKEPQAAVGVGVTPDVSLPETACCPPEKIIHDHFFGRGYLGISPTGCIYRKDKFEEVQGFNVQAGVFADADLHIRLAARYPVLLMQRPFFLYRRHPGQQQNHMEADFIIYGYHYFKALMEMGNLPLLNEQVRYLIAKMYKRHSLNLSRFLLKSLDWKGFRRILKETNFSIEDYLVGFLK
ncbi:MAG TPA: glycosyltransferase family 2 protein [Puia sp.]